MDKYMATSWIYGFSVKFYNYLLTSYSYKVLITLLNWCKHSKTNQFIVGYLARDSSLEHSVTYRLCSKVFSYIDMLWDKLYYFGIRCGTSSSVINFIRKTLSSSNNSLAYSVLVLLFSCSFGVTSILLGTFNNIKAVLLVLGIIISTLLLVEKSTWSACRKGSLFWRIALYIFD